MGAIHILDKLLPRHCVLCRARAPGNLCAGCSEDLPVIRHPCYRCAIPFDGVTESPEIEGNPGPDTTHVCGQCISNPPPFDRAIAALDYAFPVTVLVQRFKFRRSFASGIVLSDRLAKIIESTCHDYNDRPQCLVPVPLHPFRHFTRVFNQAEILALDIGRTLGIPVRSNLLRRTRRTRSQPGLTAAERQKNLKGAISARANSEQHVALVDDVMTTGATITECARALRNVGVKTVSVWVAARARGS